MNKDLLNYLLLKIFLIHIMAVQLPTINANTLNQRNDSFRPKRSLDLSTDYNNQAHHRRHQKTRINSVESMLSHAVNSPESGYATVVRQDGKLARFREFFVLIMIYFWF